MADMSFLSGHLTSNCVVLIIFRGPISMAWSACTVTEFDSGRKFAQYTFDVGQPGSLRAKVSGKDPVMDSAFWWKGDLIFSQDSMIIENYARNFTIKDDHTTGLYELAFRNNLTCGDAGVYMCSCGKSQFKVAVFVNVPPFSSCNQSTVKINNKMRIGLPGLIRVTSGSATRAVHQVDLDAGSVYPDVNSLYASWTCDTCENKAGESTGSRRVIVKTQSDLGKKFNGGHMIFNYKGVTVCFDIISEGNGQNRTRKGCTAIDATNYDTCRIYVNGMLAVDYWKDCPTPPPIIPIIMALVIFCVLVIVGAMAAVGYCLWSKQKIWKKRKRHENLKSTYNGTGRTGSTQPMMNKSDPCMA